MDNLIERLRELLAKANVLPLAYRPWQYDDWGTIRGGGTDEREESLHFIASVRDSRVDHDVYPAHRAAKTDPYEDVTKLFVEGLNALPDLLDEIARLKGENERWQKRWAASVEQGVEAEATLARNQALIEEMVEGLRPFARVKDAPSCPDSECVRVTRAVRPEDNEERRRKGWNLLPEGSVQILSFDGLSVGDFRNARTLIAKATEPAPLTPAAPSPPPDESPRLGC